MKISEDKTVYYDPPAGWLYGFPKPYQPIAGEMLRDTLIRDGYPEKDAKELNLNWIRFIGPHEELTKIFDEHCKAFLKEEEKLHKL